MEKVIRYVVTVKAVIEKEEKLGKEWKKVSDNPEEYGYTPEIVKTVQRELVVYEQIVDNLNMAELVNVVNGIN
jgi:hypothetical protein